MAYLKDSKGFIFTSDYPQHHPECTKLTIKAGRAELKAQCIVNLKALIKPGDTVRTSIKHVSSSGMQRRISFYIVDPRDQEIINIDHYVSIITDYKLSDKGGLVVNGCGMDMGFAVVYELGATMWTNGTDTPHGTRNQEPDSSGGYALKQRWL